MALAPPPPLRVPADSGPAQSIFSDSTYDKPFFLVYVNTSVFAVSLVPMFARYMLAHGLRGLQNDARRTWRGVRRRGFLKRLARGGGGGLSSPRGTADGDDGDDEAAAAAAGERLLVDDVGLLAGDGRLSVGETAVLSLEFCMLWFLANYFASACLQHTSVASVTILTSTSSVWTLVFCAALGVEAFSLRKLVGVAASLAGVVLISTVDLTGAGDEHRGSFPHKTARQIALGDAMALVSAVLYGVYVSVMKRRVGDEDRVDMGLFFGLVGVFNLALLWPLFFLLHWTGIEPVRRRARSCRRVMSATAEG